MSSRNREDLKIYVNNLGKELFALKHKLFNKSDCDLFFEMVNKNNAFFIDENINYKSLDFLIDKLKNRLYVKQSKVDSFKALNDEIIHFRKIKVREDKKEEFSEKIKETIDLKYLSENELKEKILNNEINIDDIPKYRKTFIEFEDAKFQKMLNHYYNPLISGEKLDWIKNIISEESEIVFLKELEKICNDIDIKYDWWMFSKLNQYHDKNIFIPYTEDSEEKPFYPDFIFWLQKGNKQTILFIDPKGNKHTAYEHKIDGYEDVFFNKSFNEFKTEINVKLALMRTSNDSVGKKYENYWYSKDDLLSIFNETNPRI